MSAAVTLASTDATLGGYGFVSGHVLDSSGKVMTTPVHDGTGGSWLRCVRAEPALGNYGAGANVDGSYTIGLPAGTYTLSAAVRDGTNPSAGPQATPVTVTVTAGQTTKQDIALLASPHSQPLGRAEGHREGCLRQPGDGRGHPLLGQRDRAVRGQGDP